jgi:hypothetical protein
MAQHVVRLLIIEEHQRDRMKAREASFTFQGLKTIVGEKIGSVG